MDCDLYASLGLAVSLDEKILGPNPNAAYREARRKRLGEDDGGGGGGGGGDLDAPYGLPPVSQRQPGVARGTIVAMPDFESKASFPGTARKWWLYIPAAAESAKTDSADSAAAAAVQEESKSAATAGAAVTGAPESAEPGMGPTGLNLIVFNDGEKYLREGEGATVQAAVTLDNLIASGAIPPTLGVFVDPPWSGGLPGQRFREYTSLNDLYWKMVLEELLPLVEAEHDISPDPARRAMCGASAGGIASFTVAWNTCEGPRGFGNVISHVGSFYNIQGGHNYPWLIRNTPHKEGLKRIYLQGSVNDHNKNHGDALLANRAMYSALEYAGYEVRLDVGTGLHSHAHGGSTLAEVIKWMFSEQ
eukprot:g1022.t1